MQRQEIPFNISLLNLTPELLRGIRPITSLDIYDANNNFHTDGLYSSEIFGKVGDTSRDRKFSYIDIGVKIFHPQIYKTLGKLKQMYTGILEGKIYAIWDDKIKDFVKSNPIDGQTGMWFFMTYWTEIKFEHNASTQRDDYIRLIEKYKSIALTDKIIVYPAGLRDVEVDASGRTTKDEINDQYVKLLSISNTLRNMNLKETPELFDGQRLSLQRIFNDIYEYFTSLVDGKKKFFMGKWASRKIFDGTRNVISASILDSPFLGSQYAPSPLHTMLGLYQALKSIRPIATYHVRNKILPTIFKDVNSPAILVNRKSLRKEYIQLKPYVFDKFNTDEGIEKILTNFGDNSIRHNPVIVGEHYLCLVYKDKKSFKIVHDISEVPEDFKNKGTITPITYAEFLYISCYEILYKYPIFITRYPIAGIGSIYPSIMYTKTTVVSEIKTELDENWELDNNRYKAHQFPVTGEEFLNTLVPSVTKISGMAADYDGDTSSSNAVVTDEAVSEIYNSFGKKNTYIGVDGKLIDSVAVDTVNYVFAALTGDYQE